MSPNVCMWKYSKCVLEMLEDWSAESSLCVGVESILHPPRGRGARALWWRITVNNCVVGCQEHLAWCWAGRTYEQSFLWPIERACVCVCAHVYTGILTLKQRRENLHVKVLRWFCSSIFFLSLGCFYRSFWRLLLICMLWFCIFWSRLQLLIVLQHYDTNMNSESNQCPKL